MTFRHVGEFPAFAVLGVLFLVLYFGGSLLCRAPELPELFSVMRRGQAFRIDRVSAPRPGGNGGDNAAPAVIPRFRPEKNVLKFFLPPSPDTAP